MIGFRFSQYISPVDERTPFKRLLEIFLELIVHASGDVEETFRWMEILDKEHGITDENYTLDDFRRDLAVSHFPYDNKELTLRATLKDLSVLLEKPEIMKVHRSYMINLKKIDRISKNHVVIAGVEIPITKEIRGMLLEGLRTVR